jgi:hypothetical protein
MMSSSKSLVHKDYSICTAVIGCTACARLMSDADASDKPKCFTFPSCTNFFIAPTCRKTILGLQSSAPSSKICFVIFSSIPSFGLLEPNIHTYSDFNGDFGVNTVLVVKINVLHIEPVQARFTCCSNPLWISSDLQTLSSYNNSKFSGKLYLFPHPFVRVLFVHLQNHIL